MKLEIIEHVRSSPPAERLISTVNDPKHIPCRADVITLESGRYVVQAMEWEPGAGLLTAKVYRIEDVDETLARWRGR